MSFQVVIGITRSEKTALDKTISDTKTYTGTLINNSNVVNPSILIHVGADTIANYNYMSISSFGRHYFITEITALNEKTCMVSGHVDVLSSFKASIRTNEAVIARSESSYNWYIDDGLFKVDSKTIIQTKQFDGGGTFMPEDEAGIALVLVGNT